MMMETASEDDLRVNSLSVRELKHMLHNNSVTTNGLVEKADLVARVREALQKARSGKVYESPSVDEDRCAGDEELARRLQREEDTRTRLIQEEESRCDRENPRGIFGHVGRALGGAGRIFGGVVGRQSRGSRPPPTDEDSDMARRMQEEEWAATPSPRGRRHPDGATRRRARPRGSQRPTTASAAGASTRQNERSSQQEHDPLEAHDQIMIDSSWSDEAHDDISGHQHAYGDETGHTHHSQTHADDESGQGAVRVCLHIFSARYHLHFSHMWVFASGIA
jgi:hypothetical protein